MKVKYANQDETPWNKLTRTHRRMILSLYPEMTAKEISDALWSYSREYGWHPTWIVCRLGKETLIAAHGEFRGGVIQ